MPNVNPGAPTVAPGIPTGSQLNQYPQWGVGQINGTYTTIEAKSAADKQKDISQGYVTWFVDKASAQSFADSENNNFLNGTLGISNPFSSIQNALSAFYDVVTNGKMWRSLGWLLLGVLLIIFGIVLWIGPTAFKATPIGRVASLAGR